MPTYAKPATTIDEQVKRLRARGLVVADEPLLRRWLETVGYYRLSIYWLPFEERPTDGETRSRRFGPGTRFEEVRDLYVFDRELRLIVMEAIERVEIGVRARWTNRLALAGGSHAHLNAACFVNRAEHLRLLSKLNMTVASSGETLIKHYLDKYEAPPVPPLWSVTETMTLGELSRWVKATSDRKLKDDLAKDMGLPTADTLTGTLEALTYVRNVCAHHGRLWNRRTVKYVPRIKRLRESQAYDRARGQGTTNTIYNILVVIAHILRKQSPDTSWPNRIQYKLAGVPDDHRRAMGVPGDWLARPVWSGSGDHAS